ncbi:hypothetical protein ACLMJK_002611 [Lecanora helva]
MTSMYSAEGPSIKVEPAQPALNGQDTRIKPDPDSLGASPGPQLEDDIYEDAGDLEFNEAEQGIFLAKVPKFLLESWSKLDNNQEIQIGRVKVEGGLNDIKRMSLLLSPEATGMHHLPKEYNMVVTDQHAMNTFVFSEKDLPGYRKYSHDRAPPRNKDRKRVEKFRGPTSNFRRAVPKQTNLTGQVRTEINCLPVENADFQRYVLEENRRRQDQKPKIKMLRDGDDSNVVIPGNLASSGQFGDLISTAGPLKGRKKEKAARMPQNELMDMIFNCFKDYKYWTLASLKQRLRQPEAFLKETLDKVAILTRSGTMTGKYQIKPDAAPSQHGDAAVFNNVKAEAAPDADPNALDITEDDEDEEMEDVFPR